MAILPVPPQLVISLAEPLSRRDPFSVPIKVVNDGWLPAYDLNIRCQIVRARIGGNFFGDSGFVDDVVSVQKLGHGRQHSELCGVMRTGVPPTSAEIAVIVRYKVLHVWPRKECRFFQGAAGDAWRWLERPCTEGMDRTL